MNAEIFRFYVGEMLAPTLHPGEVAVMDNLPTHKGAATREPIGAPGATLLRLAAYSFDPNPIDLMFAKLNHLPRSAGARSVDRLWTVLDDCLRKFDPDRVRPTPTTLRTRILGVTRDEVRAGEEYADQPTPRHPLRKPHRSRSSTDQKVASSPRLRLPRVCRTARQECAVRVAAVAPRRP